MTATGQRRKWRDAFVFGAISALVLVFCGGILGVFAPVSSHAAILTRVVIDPHSGIALYGFDPVAYLTEGQPTLGVSDFEYSYSGATWRFRNEGNRAAFATNPEVYAPRFGGYDPMGVARGVAMPGHPQLWVRRGDRIYLFHKEETRAAFIADPAYTLTAADGHWPQVMKDLPE
jgi:YHS domain-containing protein